jgi:Domain of unknown function (DUF1772)
MSQALQVVTILLVAVAMALGLAHALELPGKKRLTKEAYLATQPIYYPGFTIGGGIGEAGGIVAVLLLLALTPPGSAAFWLTLGALLALLAMHGTYWIFAHPINDFWLRDVELKRAGGRFFSFDPLGRSGEARAPEWTALRDRWEYSHVVRAAFALLGLALLATAVAVQK